MIASFFSMLHFAAWSTELYEPPISALGDSGSASDRLTLRPIPRVDVCVLWYSSKDEYTLDIESTLVSWIGMTKIPSGTRYSPSGVT